MGFNLALKVLTGSQVVINFLPFYVTRTFITAFTNSRQISLPWTRQNQSIHPHPTSWISVLILSSHLRLVLPSGLFTTFSNNSASLRTCSLQTRCVGKMLHDATPNVVCYCHETVGNNTYNTRVCKLTSNSHEARGAALSSVRSWKDVIGSLSNIRAVVNINKQSKIFFREICTRAVN